MRPWPRAKIGDVTQIVNGGTPKSKTPEYWDGDVLWITPKDMGRLTSAYVDDTSRKITRTGLAKSSAKLIPAGSVILSTRAPIGHLAINSAPMATNQGCRALVPSERLDTKFLFFFLGYNVALLNDLGSGTTFKELAKSALAGVEIPLPPLSEQQRIVAILDEAFEGIGVAVANAEKNLANARELFDGYLESLFVEAGSDWTKTTLGEIADFKNGLNFTRSSKGETIRIVGVADFQNNLWVPTDDLNTVQIDDELSNAYLLRAGDILTVRSNGNKQLIGRCLLAGPVPDRTSHSGFTIRIRITSEELSPEYLVQHLKSGQSRRQLIESGDGANISSLNQQALSALPISFPSLSDQATIVRRLNDINVDAARLGEIYRKKLAALVELKQSILQKAFAGELTLEIKNAQPANATISEEVKTISPEFTASVLAFAYHRHVAKRQDKTFGRVKAQKTLHLVESIAGVDLGRVPTKYAAGPYDSHHMRKATDWARENQFFEFDDRGDGYDFRKLSRYNEMIGRALEAAKLYPDKVGKVVDLVVPMKTEEAAVFATVHAAWNNLIIDGGKITDEAIIRAARDNWHSDKFKIAELKFRKAIRKIRDEGLVPDGSAKRVGGQESLDL